MIRALALAALAALAAGACLAEPVRVRSGEHEGFTRLVLSLEAGQSWSLERDDVDYLVTLNGADGFDLEEVFSIIPQTRLAGVSGSKEQLRLTLACNCSATAFETKSSTGNDALVIDISGEAPQIDVAPAAVRVEEPPREPREPAEARSFSSTNSDRYLGQFWQDLVPSPETPFSDPNSVAAAESSAREELVAASERELVRQLSRAASQGIVDLKRSQVDAPSKQSAQKTAAVAGPLPEGTDQPALVAETVLDRDSHFAPLQAPVTAEGQLCPTDQQVAIGAWGDDRPFWTQISEKNLGLMGEFDQPDVEAAAGLAKTYLYFGFSDEAQAILDDFDIDPTAASLLTAIADALEGGDGNGAPLFQGMETCDSSAAMWAVLASSGLAPGSPVNGAAINKAFSALPPHLRRLLGPRLVEKLLDAGEEGTARAVQAAQERAETTKGQETELVSAEIDAARGKLDEAEAALERVIAGNGPGAVDALEKYVDLRLQRKLPVSSSYAELAGALAHQLEGGLEWPRLARTNVLALAASGDYAAAFAERERVVGLGDPALPEALTEELFSVLAAQASDGKFLEFYFANRALLSPAEAPPTLNLRIGERLLALGFADAARAAIGPDDERLEEARMLLARIALAKRDGELALKTLSGSVTPESGALRASALSLLGRHEEAAAIHAGLGDTTAKNTEDLRAGAWSELIDAAKPASAQALRDLGLSAAPDSGTGAMESTGASAVAEGTLAEMNDALSASRKSRLAVEVLLDQGVLPAGGGE